MRNWAPIVVLSLALLAGCGSNGEESTTPSPSGSATAKASASAAAGLVARTFLRAGISGHGDVACSLMTPAAVSNLAQYVQSTGHGEGDQAHDCAEYFIAYQTSGGGTLASLKIGPVSVSGSAARASVVCPACRKKAFPPLHLRRTVPGWRVNFDYRQGY